MTHADEATTIDWGHGRWTTDPAQQRVDGAALVATAVSGSDAWRHTAYGFVHDSAHGLLAPLLVGEAVEVVVEADYAQQFDQAGLVIRVDHENWIKAGLEFADGVLWLGAVVTRGTSDWSTAPVDDWIGRPVTVRASRLADAVVIRARVDDEPFRLVRVAPFGTGEAGAGPHLAAPTRADFSARFTRWATGPADPSLH